MNGKPEKNVAEEAWYRQNRAEVERFFVPEHGVTGSEEAHVSPSGRFRVVVSEYSTQKGAWDFSRGIVYDRDRQIADVKRNYGLFPIGWAEDHPNGHHYLLCGEDYQGQAVIELDTGTRIDYVAPSAERGVAFCCA